MYTFLTRFALLTVLLIAFVTFQNQVIGTEQNCYRSASINSNIEVISTENASNIIQLLQLDNGIFNNFTVLPSGETVVVMTPTNAQVYSLNDNSAEMLFLGDCYEITYITISPNSSQIAISVRDSSSIQLWDTNSGRFWNTIETSKDKITSLAFDTTGTLLSWAASEVDEIAGDPWIGNAEVVIYDLEQETEVTTFANVADVVTELTFSSTNDAILFRGSYPGYERFDLQSWDIRTHTQLTSREEWFIFPAYAQNTSIVALSITSSLGITNEFSYQIETWNPQTDTLVLNISILNRADALALSGDGMLIASGNDEGIITIWNTNTGAQLSSFQAYSQSIQQLAFTNDGTKLISLGSDGSNQSIRIWGVEAQ